MTINTRDPVKAYGPAFLPCISHSPWCKMSVKRGKIMLCSAAGIACTFPCAAAERGGPEEALTLGPIRMLALAHVTQELHSSAVKRLQELFI